MFGSGWKRGLFSIVLAGVILTQSWAFGQTKPRVVPTNVELSSALEATAGRVSPAVVEIFTTSYVPRERVVAGTADLVKTQRASGSGVIVDADGYIVTNAHVVRGAQRLRVELPMAAGGQSILARNSNRTVSGQIVGMDLETDLAVIKVDERGLQVLEFGDSDELKPGQLVLAFGSPLGFNNSVSLGVVSAVARQLEPESPMVYVQTDASINPGSSGGALVDMRGRLVGINTLIVSEAGGNEGLGFAAPSNIVRTVYEQIRQNGHVRRGDIGVRSESRARLRRDRGRHRTRQCGRSNGFASWRHGAHARRQTDREWPTVTGPPLSPLYRGCCHARDRSGRSDPGSACRHHRAPGFL